MRLFPEADNPFYSLCIPKVFINAKVSKRGLKQFINRQRLALKYNSPLKWGRRWRSVPVIRRTPC